MTGSLQCWLHKGVLGCSFGVRGPLLLPMEVGREDKQNGFVFRRDRYMILK